MSTVVEIGPGFTSKIGIALAKIQFTGHLFIVEPNKDAIEWIGNQYSKLLPNTKIVLINRSINDAANELPINVDAVLMNHVLDDMILNAKLTNSLCDTIFSQMRPEQTCHPLVQKTWLSILDNPSTMASLSQQVLDELCQFLSHINPQLFATSQYHSWFLKENELQKANLLGLQLLSKLRLCFGDTNEKFDVVLKKHAQIPSQWLFIERNNNQEIFSKITPPKLNTTQF
jgi:hypothetical protein